MGWGMGGNGRVLMAMYTISMYERGRPGTFVISIDERVGGYMIG